MKGIARKMRWWLRSFAIRWPSLHMMLLKMHHDKRSRLALPGKRIVIEGYPRSGNTFVVAAVLHSQDCGFDIAHHLHAPVQIILAKKHRIPCLALLRDPEDAIVSLSIRERDIPISVALRDYIAFHEAVKAHRSSLVLATFEAATERTNEVMEAINSKFGMNLDIGEYSEEDVKKIFKSVEEMDMKDRGREVPDEMTVARPSIERQRLREGALVKLRKYDRLLGRARRIYQELRADADVI